VKRAVWFDLLGALLFVIIGLHNHHHGETLVGILSTWWPFAVGVVVAWIVEFVAHRGGESLVDAGSIVVMTVAVGMVLRVLAGQGTAVAFIIVALAFLYLFFGGWRWVMHRWRRRPGTRDGAL
jgi:hypothetical protein